MNNFNQLVINNRSPSHDRLWELFHENSKLRRSFIGPSQEAVRHQINQVPEVLDFKGYPLLPLPSPLKLKNVSLTNLLSKRQSNRNMIPDPISTEELATLFHYAYGVSHKSHSSSFPRSFRTVPSAGALYPLEIFFYSENLTLLDPGLYHYNPLKHQLRHIRMERAKHILRENFVDPCLVDKATLLIFIAGIFERTTFKYGERGYRFVLLEAGHVAQNLNLVSTALGLNSVNIGGFFDQNIDDFLKLDGVTHSTLYIVGIGKKSPIVDSVDE